MVRYCRNKNWKPEKVLPNFVTSCALCNPLIKSYNLNYCLV